MEWADAEFGHTQEAESWAELRAELKLAAAFSRVLLGALAQASPEQQRFIQSALADEAETLRAQNLTSADFAAAAVEGARRTLEDWRPARDPRAERCEQALILAAAAL
jgi:hypothetical protein